MAAFDTIDHNLTVVEGVPALVCPLGLAFMALHLTGSDPIFPLAGTRLLFPPSIVTTAVYVAVWEIFNVKEWRDLGNQVIRGRSRSLKMAPFDRQYAT